MKSEQSIVFPPFRLDLMNEQLWRGTERLLLRPKPFAVLRYLAAHPSRLVTKEELTKSVWPDTYVGESSLKGYIRDVREVLGDDPEAPQFIETVARRGYRFIAAIHGKEHDIPQQSVPAATLGVGAVPLPLGFVGREGELAQLHRWFDKALQGERQVVFVTGEPGIGKTTLVDVFLERVRTTPGVWIGRGQCVAQYGTGEAYLPILETLSQLGRAPQGERLLALLRRQAPSWLAQLPALLEPSEIEALQRTVSGVTRERMLRELADALDTLTAEQPLVLVLEDLHWSDFSTIDVLSAVAQRRGAAQLFVLGTYRPTEVILSQHPLRAVTQELLLHHQCVELALPCLTLTDVNQYLAVKFPQQQFPAELGRLLYQQTDGHPLFLVAAVEDLVTRRMIDDGGRWQLHVPLTEVAGETPASVQQLIVRQFERLAAEEQHLLEVASVAGGVFSSAAVAAGLETAVERVEERCEGLARREYFLQADGMERWPDGTIAGRFRFVHALYQQVLYERIGAARRVWLHQRIGTRQESGYGARAGEIAAALALHFERGQHYQQAVQYVEQAAQQAMQRSAYTDAIRLLTKGLALLPSLPDTPERTQYELSLNLALGVSLAMTKGYAASETEQAYARALALSRQVGHTPHLFPVLYGLVLSHLERASYQTARELGEEISHLAQTQQNPSFLLDVHMVQGVTLIHVGESGAAQTLLEQGLALYDPHRHHSHTLLYGHDPSVACLSLLSYALGFQGYPEQVRTKSEDALAVAREDGHPFNVAFALHHLVTAYSLCRAYEALLPRVEESLQLDREQGFLFWIGMDMVVQGRCFVEQGRIEEGLRQMQDGLAAFQTVGGKIASTYLLGLLTEGYRKWGQPEEGLRVVTEALAFAQDTGERFFEAELYRLRGECLLQMRGHGRTSRARQEAEQYLQQALAIARRQSAKLLELRAATSLSRLWQRQGKKKEAGALLAEIYGWFTEGFDTADLQEAKALLGELS